MMDDTQKYTIISHCKNLHSKTFFFFNSSPNSVKYLFFFNSSPNLVKHLLETIILSKLWELWQWKFAMWGSKPISKRPESSNLKQMIKLRWNFALPKKNTQYKSWNVWLKHLLTQFIEVPMIFYLFLLRTQGDKMPSMSYIL